MSYPTRPFRFIFKEALFFMKFPYLCLFNFQPFPFPVTIQFLPKFQIFFESLLIMANCKITYASLINLVCLYFRIWGSCHWAEGLGHSSHQDWWNQGKGTGWSGSYWYIRRKLGSHWFLYILVNIKVLRTPNAAQNLQQFVCNIQIQ